MSDKGVTIETRYRGQSFRVENPCPQCGAHDVLGYYLVSDDGAHQHTRYVCTRWWRRTDTMCGWCGWQGWTVPDAPPPAVDYTYVGRLTSGPPDRLYRCERCGAIVGSSRAMHTAWHAES